MRMRRIGGLGPQFGGVPPRPFVRGKRAGFHELSIVVRPCGAPVRGSRMTTGAAAVSRSPRDPPSIIGTIARVSGRIETKSEHDWLVLTPDELAVGAAYDWAIRPDCGAVVVFSGTVRDHAEGREGVDHLTYEAYEDKVLDALRRDLCRDPPPLARHRTDRDAGIAPAGSSSANRRSSRSSRHRTGPRRSRPAGSRSMRSRSRLRSGSTRCGPMVPIGAPERATSPATSPEYMANGSAGPE